MDGQPSITDRLNLAFSRSKLKQSDLARRVGVTRGAVNGWLRGRAVNIRPEHLFAIADVLGIEARWLATGKGEMAKRPLNADEQGLMREYESLRADEQRAVRLLISQIAEGRATYKP